MPDLSVRLLINIFLILGALFALWKGGAAERIAAAMVIANALLGEAGHWLFPGDDTLVRLVNDGTTAIGLLVVTVFCGSLWMGGVMLFFAAQFSMHSYYLVMDRPKDNLHALVNNVDWISITLCLVIGAAVSWRRRALGAARPPRRRPK